jgi:hypothetical protein
MATPQSAHLVTADLPHGIPLSLSLDTNSIWQFIGSLFYLGTR